MKERKVYETSSAQETFEIGRRLGEEARRGMVYALNGDLGTGKTVFSKGFAAGLGIVEPVSSPTFTILQIYEEGRLPLYHFDVYRIEDPDEMEEVGLDEYLEGDGVCLIEWAERIEELLPEDCIRVDLEKEPARGNDLRRITITG
ncbi:MAG: tRNA (adenosine(37)-N6)-threonylcarbamoyltransferase complex ATPase subunit type 1 TsaE [Lachnospiraceae bacterium]|nr:tRNA (adenosine(37)-N6)-threonylcarbamoyltransferase complex ATPase subunit type 1 TsaE [Lachnospiraceae bacterium]